ncbi:MULTISPECIES: S16 family serine protease [Pyrobaculum]|uniref:Peptidase S16, lon domain protein n=2 Tax=Pyrobaculum arsenaticum TaxID=121277 RepID=A4WM90_PYRAR|nr:S16 family serine protease [Pyrobaculum arsenaticum]ABP51507.1 peptidase S16, lon domain protein [Pyrobaculum arsenaticum DSM 13514]MCY0890985.1 peptidase S16 [Pyrobaculum arsenaticum]NYR16524.1 peptidase S16 [Pyrobaculum arsenaticum]
MRKLVLIAVLAVFLVATTWQSYTVRVSSVEINALAVGPTGGAVLPIEVTLITPGDGRAYVAGVPEAGQGFGPSAQIALYTASRLAGVPYANYTALLRVLSADAQVGGPSASGYITVALYALMKGLNLKNDTAMTGIILPDGLIGPVGGVSQKVGAAAEKGIKTVLVPIGEAPSGAQGVRVIEIGTVEEAIYYLTGERIDTPPPSSVDDAVFKNISKKLFNDIYSYYNSTIGRGYVDVGLINKLKAQGYYYAAASLIYQGIVNYYRDQAASSRRTYRDLYDKALQMAKAAESELSKIPVTINNLDLVVASYTRIYEVYFMANSSNPDAGAMYARAVTLSSWVGEARQMAYGPALNDTGLAEVALLYLDYAKTMEAYLETTYGVVATSNLPSVVEVAQDLYRRGHYLASMANSIEVIAQSASALMAAAPDKYLTVARERALTNMARAAACGYTNTLPLSYLQFGDYYRTQQDGASLALGYYIMASIYSTAMGDAACTAVKSGAVIPRPSLSPVYTTLPPTTEQATTRTASNMGGEEKTVILPLVLALLAAVALVYASRR